MSDFDDRPEYEVSEDAAIILNYGTPEQAVVKGLTKLNMPGINRNTTKIAAFRGGPAITKTTGAEFGTIAFSGNEVSTDLKGQRLLRRYLKNNTEFNHARAYRNLVDFVCCDLAANAKSCWQVSKMTPGSVDKNGVYPFDGEIVLGGPFAEFFIHMTADTIAFVATGNKVTDSGNGFLTAGFEAGQTLIVEGSGANNGYYLIKEVAAGTLTLDAAVKSVADGVVGTMITLHGGEM